MPKSKLASHYTFFGAPGPFTVELAQFSSRLIGKCIKRFFIKGGQMLAGFLCIPCCSTDGNNIVPVWTRQHQIDGLHVERHRGRCFAHSDTFSCEIRSASCELKENYETQRDEIYFFFKMYLFFFWSIVLLPLASMSTRHCIWVTVAIFVFRGLSHSCIEASGK